MTIPILRYMTCHFASSPTATYNCYSFVSSGISKQRANLVTSFTEKLNHVKMASRFFFIFIASLFPFLWVESVITGDIKPNTVPHFIVCSQHASDSTWKTLLIECRLLSRRLSIQRASSMAIWWGDEGEGFYVPSLWPLICSVMHLFGCLYTCQSGYSLFDLLTFRTFQWSIFFIKANRHMFTWRSFCLWSRVTVKNRWING